MNNHFEIYYNKARAFEEEALRILSKYDLSKPRVISLSATRKKLFQLTLKQQNLFDQAIRCAEFALSRSSIVMAWAGFIDYFEQKIAEDKLQKVYLARPNWQKYTSIEDIVDNIPEYQILEVGKEIGLIRKAEFKSLRGLLSSRNECAHPGTHAPSVNEAIGYISDLLQRIEALSTRSI